MIGIAAVRAFLSADFALIMTSKKRLNDSAECHGAKGDVRNAYLVQKIHLLHTNIN